MTQVHDSPNVKDTPTVVHANDLPLCCPMPNQALWNQHPRVYLPIEKAGEAVCPYCGYKYILKK